MKIDVTQIIVVVITALVIPFIKVQIVPLIQAFMKNIQTKFERGKIDRCPTKKQTRNNASSYA